MNEINFEEFLREINSEKYIFMDKLYELGELSLVIELTGAKIEATDEESLAEIAEEFGQKVAELTKGAMSIEPDESKRWRLTFERYIGFSVINESFYGGDRGTFDSPCCICVTEDSDWLDYVKKSTFAYQVQDGIKHYEIKCLDHIINAAADREPQVERI